MIKIIKNYFDGFALKINDKILEGKLLNFQQNSINEVYAFVGEGILTQKEFLKRVYPEFAKIADEEGFKDIAVVLRNIAIAEKQHEKRYNDLAANIENGTVFKRDEEVVWRCRNCGFIYEGTEAPEECPACAHAQAYFELLGENY